MPGAPLSWCFTLAHFLGEVRIKPFLNALLGARRHRRLPGGRSFDDDGRPAEVYSFTHIWCQRNVSTPQFRFLKRHVHVPIIYDVDDLITSFPDFVMRVKPRVRTRIDWCLGHAKAVTVATELFAGEPAEDTSPCLAKLSC